MLRAGFPRLRLTNLIKCIQLFLVLVVTWTIELSSAAGTTAENLKIGSRSTAHHDSSSSSSNTILHRHGSHHNEEGYWREVKAIIGGVLGFWGGVGSLGTLFLVIVLSQRYCCRKDDDKVIKLLTCLHCGRKNVNQNKDEADG